MHSMNTQICFFQSYEIAHNGQKTISTYIKPCKKNVEEVVRQLKSTGFCKSSNGEMKQKGH